MALRVSDHPRWNEWVACCAKLSVDPASMISVEVVRDALDAFQRRVLALWAEISVRKPAPPTAPIPVPSREIPIPPPDIPPPDILPPPDDLPSSAPNSPPPTSYCKSPSPTSSPPHTFSTSPPPLTNSPPPISHLSPPPLSNSPPPPTHFTTPPISNSPPPILSNSPPPMGSQSPIPQYSTSPTPYSTSPPPILSSSPPPYFSTSPPQFSGSPPPQLSSSPPPFPIALPPIAPPPLPQSCASPPPVSTSPPPFLPPPTCTSPPPPNLPSAWSARFQPSGAAPPPPNGNLSNRGVRLSAPVGGLQPMRGSPSPPAEGRDARSPPPLLLRPAATSAQTTSAQPTSGSGNGRTVLTMSLDKLPRSQPISLADLAQDSPSPSVQAPTAKYVPPSAMGATVIRYFENCYSTGLLTIRIIGAFNLSFKGVRIPNAFTALKVGDAVKFKTKTVWQEASPLWEEEFSMELADNTNVHMQLDLISYNRIVSNEVIGTVPFQVDVAACKSKEFTKQPLKLSSGTSGQVTFAYNFVTSTERNSDYKIAKTYFNQIFPMLKMPAVVVPLCEVLKTDDGASVAVVRLLNQHNCIHGLITQLLIEDITQTDKGTGNVLFRTNTAATNLVGHYFRLIGYAYLGNTLGAILNTVVANPNNYDIDPTRIGEEDNLEANRARLASVIEAIMTSIASSAESVPLNIRNVFLALKPVAEANYFPASLCVVGIFFLRFIGYALCSPEKCYLSSEVTPEAFKVLSTIARVSQTVVNRRKDFEILDDKVINVLRPYFTVNIGSLLDTFIEKLLEPRSTGPPDELHSVISSEDEIKFLAVLIRRLNTHRTQIETWFKKRLPDTPLPEQEQSKRAYSTIWNALATATPQHSQQPPHQEKPKRKFF
ncbi:hypothetical protein Pelo_17134 [Pelomyxa schiedti]|nr:hypothetical protein Pelo_17134 [Pelomyxa schiedti]